MCVFELLTQRQRYLMESVCKIRAADGNIIYYFHLPVNNCHSGTQDHTTIYGRIGPALNWVTRLYWASLGPELHLL